MFFLAWKGLSLLGKVSLVWKGFSLSGKVSPCLEGVLLFGKVLLVWKGSFLFGKVSPCLERFLSLFGGVPSRKSQISLEIPTKTQGLPILCSTWNVDSV